MRSCSREYERNGGRHSTPSTSAANPRRTSEVPDGPRSSNRVAARAAPIWIEVTPASTIANGGTRSIAGDGAAVDARGSVTLASYPGAPTR